MMPLQKIPNTDSLDKLIADRLAVVDMVRKVCPQIEWKGKDAATLMKEVVALKCPELQLDSKSADYISVRFDMLTEDSDNSQHHLDNAFTDLVKKKVIDKGDDNRPESVIAREKMMNDSQNAWKPKGNK